MRPCTSGGPRPTSSRTLRKRTRGSWTSRSCSSSSRRATMRARVHVRMAAALNAQATRRTTARPPCERHARALLAAVGWRAVELRVCGVYYQGTRRSGWAAGARPGAGPRRSCGGTTDTGDGTGGSGASGAVRVGSGGSGSPAALEALEAPWLLVETPPAESQPRAGRPSRRIGGETSPPSAGARRVLRRRDGVRASEAVLNPRHAAHGRHLLRARHAPRGLRSSGARDEIVADRRFDLAKVATIQAVQRGVSLGSHLARWMTPTTSSAPSQRTAFFRFGRRAARRPTTSAFSMTTAPSRAELVLHGVAPHGRLHHWADGRPAGPRRAAPDDMLGFTMEQVRRFDARAILRAGIRRYRPLSLAPSSALVRARAPLRPPRRRPCRRQPQRRWRRGRPGHLGRRPLTPASLCWLVEYESWIHPVQGRRLPAERAVGGGHAPRPARFLGRVDGGDGPVGGGQCTSRSEDLGDCCVLGFGRRLARARRRRRPGPRVGDGGRRAGIESCVPV